MVRRPDRANAAIAGTVVASQISSLKNVQLKWSLFALFRQQLGDLVPAYIKSPPYLDSTSHRLSAADSSFAPFAVIFVLRMFRNCS